MDKIIEKIIYNRIVNTAEKYGLFPDNQIKNRKNKFIKIIIRIITKAVYVT